MGDFAEKIFTRAAPFRMTPPQKSRLIWLRRPPRLTPSSIPFVPSAEPEKVDEAWKGLVQRNPRMTDGPCWHVVGVHRDGHGGATIHLTRTTYRMGAVRGVGISTGFVGLGTKAIALCGGRLLIGKRAAACATYPSHWEFAPGGAVEPDEDPARGIERELMEECALRPITPPRAIALLFDASCSNWEIVHELAIDALPDAPPNWEYSSLCLIDGVELPTPVSPCALSMMAIAQRVLSAPRNPSESNTRR